VFHREGLTDFQVFAGYGKVRFLKSVPLDRLGVRDHQ
jgi:hypothetical protein